MSLGFLVVVLCSFTYDLAEGLRSPAPNPQYSACSQHFIYRLKPEEEAAKVSASGLALHLSLTYYWEFNCTSGIIFCYHKDTFKGNQ